MKPWEFDWYDKLYLSYDMAFVNSDDDTIRFENHNGWYEEAELSPELAMWMLKRGIEIHYE